MLPVLIGAVIGAVAYSMFKDEDSSDKSSTCVEEKEAKGTEINLDSSAEVLKDLVCSARKVLVKKREDALARGDIKKVLEMDEKLLLMDEYLYKANQIAADVMEKLKDEKTVQKEKTELDNFTVEHLPMDDSRKTVEFHYKDIRDYPVPVREEILSSIYKGEVVCAYNNLDGAVTIQMTESK